jgi:hypothetical protein
MTLTIELDLTPEQEQALHAQAVRRGLSIADYAAALLEKHLPRAGAAGPSAASSAAADSQDRAAAFREWAESHNMDNPQLAEDSSRPHRS